MADDDLHRWWRSANRVPTGITHTDTSRRLMDEIRAEIVGSGPPVEEPRRCLNRPTARRGVVLAWVIGALVVVVPPPPP